MKRNERTCGEGAQGKEAGVLPNTVLNTAQQNAKLVTRARNGRVNRGIYFQLLGYVCKGAS